MSGIGKSNVFIASQFASCLICDQSIELESDWGLFSSTDLEGTASVQWSSVQTMLEQAKSDVLLLLDCCQAASTIAASGNGVTEIIAACGFETEAPGVGEHSFTRSLIDELKYLSQGSPFTAAFLHNKVLSRIIWWNPRFGKFGPREVRKTPVYIQLANEAQQRSITLSPLMVMQSNSFSIPAESSSQSSEPPAETFDENGILSAESSQSSIDEVWPDPEFKYPKVIISIALEDDQEMHTEQLTDWLTSMPALVNSMHIEGIYKSQSTLIMVSLPVAVWDLLPSNPAISFIAFVQSRNLLHHTIIPKTAHQDATHIIAEKKSSLVSTQNPEGSESTVHEPISPRSDSQHRPFQDPDTIQQSTPPAEPVAVAEEARQDIISDSDPEKRGDPNNPARKFGRYILLNAVLPGYHIPNMLGRVVSFVTDPLADFIPQSDPQHIDFNPRDIVPDLFYEPVQYDDVAHLLEEMGDVTITKMLKQRLQIYASNTKSRNFKIKAGVVTRYDMIHAERNLAVLVKDASYATQVLEMFERRKAKSLAMVTGMLTCRDLTVGWTYSEKFHEMEAEIKEEVVFALAYDEVKLKQVKKSSKTPLGIQLRTGMASLRSKKSERQSQFRPDLTLGAHILGPGLDLVF